MVIIGGYMQDRDLKKLMGDALKMTKRFEKTQEKIHVNHSKRQELRNEVLELLQASEKLKKELPNPLDPCAYTKPITDKDRENQKQFRLILRKIFERQEKIRILKQEADAILDKSEEDVTKEVDHGYDMMNKKLEEFDKKFNDDKFHINKS